MAKRLTQEDWIKRANEVHDFKYDYSLVDYKNKETKVSIICPKHGVFEQIPNNHIRGKGCPECSPNFRMDQKAFVEKANIVHNYKYDYSKSKFTRTADKVLIICPEHGEFEQEANSHLQGSGCPTCADISRSIKVSNHPTRVESIRQTNLLRYGVSNAAMVPEFKKKQVATLLERYGVDNYTKTQEYNDKYRQTVMEKYGVPHYSQTDEFMNKLKTSMLEKHGVDNYAKSVEYHDRLPEILALSRQTQRERYGANHFAQSEAYHEILPELLKRNNETKRKNGTFNVSKPERNMSVMLKSIFGEDDVVEQYNDVRYPFLCDFYIKSRDLFIELNASWTHTNHWYCSSDDDSFLLKVWANKNSDYYDNAIKTWTERDVCKRTVAKDNNLNYLVFWDVDLVDFMIWVEMGMPDGEDYIREYSWLKSRALSVEKRTFKKLTPYAITQLVRYYQQKVFYEKELNLWNTNAIHKDFPLQMKLYMNRYKYLDKAPYDLTDKQLLGSFAISGMHRGYSSFDSSLMAEVIEKYQPNHIFDPFAGWGERMIMCSHQGVVYEGVDINDNLKKGYDTIISDMGLTNVSFTVADSIGYTPSKNADMLLTCPPYHNVEVYSKNGLETKSYVDFLESWRQLVEKNKDIPLFCFQINQQYKQSMKDIVEAQGFELIDNFTYSSNKASHFQRQASKNMKREYEEMLVFKKIKCTTKN